MSEPGDRCPPLDASALATAGIEVVEQAPSTNALLAERARARPIPHGTTIAAEQQTAGRGRLDRSWEARPGDALTFSVLLRPEVPASRWPWLPLIAGVAVAQTLIDHGYDAVLKWPNDVLLGGGKVAGLLVERIDADAPVAIVGIGLNVHTRTADLPVPTATSLALHAPAPDRTALLRDLVRALIARHDAWRLEPDAAAADYRRLCDTLGRTVRVDLPAGQVLEGTAESIDSDGRLVVAGSPVGAGDVVHVRPAR